VSEHGEQPDQHPEQRLGGDHPLAQRAEQVDDRAPHELERAGEVQRRGVADLRGRNPAAVKNSEAIWCSTDHGRPSAK
jgi:hypothetical protein